MMGFARCVNGLGEMPLAKKTLPYPVMRALLKIIGKHRVLPLVEKAKKNEPVEETFLGHFGLQMLRRNHLAIFSDSPDLPPDIGPQNGDSQEFHRRCSYVSWATGKARSGQPCGCFRMEGRRTRVWLRSD